MISIRCIFSFLKVKYLWFCEDIFLVLLLIIYAELDTCMAINFLSLPHAKGTTRNFMDLSKPISGIKALMEIGKYRQQQLKHDFLEFQDHLGTNNLKVLKNACIHGKFAMAAGLVHPTTIYTETYHKTKHTMSQCSILQKAATSSIISSL